MANLPKSFIGKDILQPGSRGQVINPKLPGYRDGADRITRTQTNLPVNQHDVPNIKWELDRRLPALFKYGYDFGYKQITIPKGRMVALDPNMNQFSFDDKKAHNVLTIANGGNWTVKQTEAIVEKAVDAGCTAPATGYNNKEFVEISGAEQVITGGESVHISNHALMAGWTIGEVLEDGRTVATNGSKSVDAIAPNVPVGMLQKNQHTVNDNAMNGYMPGPVLTDALVELPLFATRQKAEENPWGSAYGTLLPGDLVKSDANGRITISPLSRREILFGTAGQGGDVDAGTFSTGLSAAQIEYERQQVVGQVYEVRRDLVPFGSAKYVQWALSDRMNFNEFNPMEKRANFRDGEDLNENSPYGRVGGGSVKTTDNLTGMDDSKFPGHPYDNTMTEHDLHMLASTARKAGNRMSLEHTLDQGIPGLTDGYNAVCKTYGPEMISSDLRKPAEGVAATDITARLSRVNVVEGTVKIAVTEKTRDKLVDGDFVTAAVGQKLPIGSVADAIEVKYLNELQGLLVFKVLKPEALGTPAGEGTPAKIVNIFAQYHKRGLSGVPTFLDWDGCQGVVSILLQR